MPPSSKSPTPTASARKKSSATPAKPPAASGKAAAKKGIATAPAKAPKAPPATAERAKPAAKPRPAGRSATVGADQRHNYIEVAAYFIAERRGFAPGNLDEDWAAAEAQIDRLLADGKLNA